MIYIQKNERFNDFLLELSYFYEHITNLFLNAFFKPSSLIYFSHNQAQVHKKIV